MDIAELQLPHLNGLNPQQKAAATYGLEPFGKAEPTAPLLIIAGAGSGKTKTLTHRVAHLIINGADPRRILLMTFARRMASEMTRRVHEICGQAFQGQGFRPDAIEWSGTFHATGAKLLRLYAETIGLDPSFSILDRADAEDLMDLVREDLKLSESRNRFPKKSTCLGIYSFVVNAECGLHEALMRVFPWCLEHEEALTQLFGAYVEAKQAQGALDYDDLLLYWAKMMQVPELARLVSERFDHVLVDEYQDTNALQAAILMGLKPDGYGLTVVGDDAQSIYSFRSANIKNILGFPNLFDPPAHMVKLEQNYRSTQPILLACNKIIARSTECFDKKLFSDRQEGGKPVLAMVPDESAQVEFIINRILANREAGMELKDQAVLMRASQHSGQLEIELTRRNIPFIKFGGLKFLEAGHIKDVISILRWAENPKDQVAGMRVLKLLPGIGPAIARRAMEGISGAQAGFAALAQFDPGSKARQAWQPFITLMQGLARGAPWPTQLGEIRKWYDPLLSERYDNSHTRLGDLDQLEKIASGHPSRLAFITDLALDPPEAVGAEAGPPVKDEDWLILSTIHSAKGQEWRAIYVLNVVDGCIPSDMATSTVEEIEEERRLLYVAMTRAKDDLVLMQPMRFYVRGQASGSDKHVYAPRSRFLNEADISVFEVLTPKFAASAAELAAQAAKVDLKVTMKAMWKK